MSEDQSEPKISFAQHELPPLEAGEYRLTVAQQIRDAVGQTRLCDLPDKTYHFFVCGERFSLRPNQVVKVFPPENSSGNSILILPHVVLARTTLPWERSPYTDPTEKDPAQNGDVTPWLAVLLFDQGDPPPKAQPASSGQDRQYTVQDLGPDKVCLEVPKSGDAKPGLLPPGRRSYFQQGSWEKLLDFGQTPDDPCRVIDIPVDLWMRVAPTKLDLPWLAHTRTAKYDKDEQSYALVIGSRQPAAGHTCIAHLVSLENLGDCLPEDGDASAPPGLDNFDFIRLVSLKSWQFTTAASSEEKAGKFADLLQNLVGAYDSDKRIDGLLHRPPAELNANSTDSQAIQDRLAQGYTALPYQTRTGRLTVSWYRGPIVPARLPAIVRLPTESADALTYLDTEHNIYDTSYGAAWQLGRLLALASRSFAAGLFRWKLAQVQGTVQAAAQNLDRRQRQAFYTQVTSSLQNQGKIDELNNQAVPMLPDDLLAWLADLSLLRGVPFWYLVPDESMLPPESIRFFLVDQDWVSCLIDGALSIGRATESVWKHDQAFVAAWFKQINSMAGAPTQPLSGFLLRSQAVKGWWPGIRADGYSSTDTLKQLRFELLTDSTLLALFDGEITKISIHEPLEGIHFSYQQTIPDNGARATGVLDIHAIASERSNYVSPFTAAEFALSMIAKPPKVVFELK